MRNIASSKLNRRKKYLQVALNSTLDEAYKIISQLPRNERILLEVGTPLIKKYGVSGIEQIKKWYDNHINGSQITTAQSQNISGLLPLFLGKSTNNTKKETEYIEPYIIADLKTMDRGKTEVEIAASGGANAAIALGSAPIETLDEFIFYCEKFEIDAMIDMMNVEYPLAVLSKLKKIPPVIIIHRGVDEEHLNKEKQIPLYEIRRIKGAYDIMISIAGGDTIREVQRSIFNDADIVVIWKSVYQNTAETANLVKDFLKEIK